MVRGEVLLALDLGVEGGGCQIFYEKGLLLCSAINVLCFKKKTVEF
jgi:hypothetical protein